MPTNDFLPIGQSASTILTQSAWNALSQRTAGWAAGILPPEHYNKSLRQSSTIAAMIGEFIKTIGGLDALDDSDNATLLANFIASLDTRIGGGPVDVSTLRVVTSGPVTAPPSSPTGNDEVLVGDSPSGAFVGNDRKLARWNGTGWVFSTVRPGRIFRVNNTDVYWTLDASTGWQTFVVPIAFVSGLQAALNAKVAKSGDTMTGELTAPALHASSGGKQIYIRQSGGVNRIDSYNDPISATVDLIINAASHQILVADSEVMRVASTGNVGIGVSGPNDKLDVNGGIRGTKLRATVVGAANGVELADSVLGTQWAQYLASGNYGLYSYVTGNVGQKFAVSPAGGVGVSGDFGTTGKVLVGGTTATWKTFSEIGIGKKLIYLASPGGPSITVTFPVAEPDTSYSVIGLTLSDNGSGYLTSSAGVTITGKTVDGFTATGIGTSSINIVFLAAIR